MIDDPLGLIPRRLPPHPRVALTRADIARATGFGDRHDWAREGYELTLEAAEAALGLSQDVPESPDFQLNGRLAKGASDLAYAYALAGDERYAAKAAALVVALARRYPGFPLTEHGNRGTDALLHEKHWLGSLAAAYDLVYNSHAVSDADRTLIERDLLREGIETTVRFPFGGVCVHRTCGNHRTAGLAALMAAGLAIGEPEYIAEAIYGRIDPRDGERWAGFIHQIAHDVLADGLHWERGIGYHFYTLMTMTHVAEFARASGIDLYHLEVQVEQTARRGDMHAAYGPPGTSSLRVMFEAPLYAAFSDFNFDDLGDSGLKSLFDVHIWGPIYELAFAEYGDPRFAWLLNRMYRAMSHSHAQRPPEPRRWQHPRSWGGSRFTLVRAEDLPAGAFSLAPDAQIVRTGRHSGGCTLFPTTGLAILRDDAADPQALNALVNFGPHHAGHQHPDLLHLSAHVFGTTAFRDSGGFGYDNPLHGTWSNQTIAHNTVTVDCVSQRPQGSSVEMFEVDPSPDCAAGRLVFFQPTGPIKAARVSTINAYEGVTLDRTIAIVQGVLVDLFLASSDDEHQYDWCLHGAGEVRSELAMRPSGSPLADEPGYSHVSSVRCANLIDKLWTIEWGAGDHRVSTLLAGGQEAILGEGLTGQHLLLAPPQPATHPMAIMRTRGRRALFVALYEPCKGAPRFRSISAEQRDDAVAVLAEGAGRRLRLLISSSGVTREQGGG